MAGAFYQTGNISNQYTVVFIYIRHAQGKGLGDEFLRHVERTKVLVHLIDAYQKSITATYQVIREELKAYRVDLSTKPEIIAISKVDGLDEDIIADLIQQLRPKVPADTPIFAISASSGQGLKELLYKISEVVTRANEAEELAEENRMPVISLPDTSDAWTIVKTDDGFVLTGEKIERFAMRTDFENEEGVARLRDILRKVGIMHDLERRRIKPETDIIIGAKREYGRFKY